MENDLSTVQFNKNRKIDAAALDIITGTRLILLSFFINFLLLLIAINGSLVSPFLPGLVGAIPSWIQFCLGVASFGCGAYGFYLVVDALGWSGFITGFFIVSLLIAYIKLVVLIVLLVKGLEVLGKSAYRFSLFGKPRKREG